MNKFPLPEDITRFFQQNIDNIAEWEGLLLVRANSDMLWSSENLAQGLYISTKESAEILMKLRNMGIIAADPEEPSFYRYEPHNDGLKSMIDRAALLYTQYLIPITHLIHAKPASRIQEFADAFKLRKDKE